MGPGHVCVGPLQLMSGPEFDGLSDDMSHDRNGSIARGRNPFSSLPLGAGATPLTLNHSIPRTFFGRSPPPSELFDMMWVPRELGRRMADCHGVLSLVSLVPGSSYRWCRCLCLFSKKIVFPFRTSKLSR